ncbi:MAG: hypothetical protein ACOVP4_07120 [Bacteriovoracaceae bacterium]
MKAWMISLITIFFTSSALATVPETFKQNNTTYRSYFGECPSKSSGALALTVMKEFEKNHSLKDVKEKILDEKLDEKHFLSVYKINYNPVIKTLNIHFECPAPLMKVQVYKTNGLEQYSAIMADNGKLYDPSYEHLMRAEKKLAFELPLLAMPVDQLEGDAARQLVDLVKQTPMEFRQKISEIIVNKNAELTIIFGLGGRATSVFMGADIWEEKMRKLIKVIGYVEQNRRYPSSISLVNAKKVVVKFSDKI